MSRRQTSFALVAALLVVAGLVAAIARIWWVTPIRDLTVAEVARVEASSLPPARLDNGLRHTLIEHRIPLIRITLNGGSGWLSEIDRKELNSYPIVVRCDRPDAELFALGPYVDGVSLGQEERTGKAPSRGAGPARYVVYVPIRGRYRSRKDFNAATANYDLDTERADLCIRIAGGAMTGAYGESNTVRVTISGA